MARAKQTNRAEARRRYRQSLAQEAGESEAREASESPSAGSSGAGSGGAGRQAPAANAGRPSLGASFRGAYHAANYREDLRALPGLLTLAQPARIPFTRTVVGIPWFLVSAFLVIAGFVALLASPTTIVSGTPGASPTAAATASAAPASSSAGPTSPQASTSPGATTAPSTVAPSASAPTGTPTPSGGAAAGTSQGPFTAIGALLFQLLSLPPGGPTLPVLLVGFMATRASYMQGFLIGLLDLALVGIYVTFVPGALPAGSTAADTVFTAAVTGLPTSILFAAAAAWYRRFLALSSPRRVQPQRGASRGRSNARSAPRR